MAPLKAHGVGLWFAKLDVSNMFYTCKLPPGKSTAFLIRHLEAAGGCSGLG